MVVKKNYYVSAKPLHGHKLFSQLYCTMTFCENRLATKEEEKKKRRGEEFCSHAGLSGRHCAVVSCREHVPDSPATAWCTSITFTQQCLPERRDSSPWEATNPRPHTSRRRQGLAAHMNKHCVVFLPATQPDTGEDPADPLPPPTPARGLTDAISSIYTITLSLPHSSALPLHLIPSTHPYIANTNLLLYQHR